MKTAVSGGLSGGICATCRYFCSKYTCNILSLTRQPQHLCKQPSFPQTLHNQEVRTNNIEGKKWLENASHVA